MPILRRPAVVLPPHRVSTEDLVRHFASLFKDHDRLEDSLSVMSRTGVAVRWYSRSLDELSSHDTSVDDRLRHHHEDALALALPAARQAIDIARISPEDIGCLVVVGTGGHTMPGIDADLVGSIPLPRTVRRIPVTQMGCAGGGYALARAAEQLSSLPRAHVLVVCADLFVPYVHNADTGMDAMIFRGMMGDAAAACVVSHDESGRGPRMVITDTWDYTLPWTSEIVGTRVRQDGMHIHNSVRMYDALRSVLPALVNWFGTKPNFVISHPGGPRVIDALVKALGVSPSLLDPTRQSLEEIGNAGSVSVLDVLRRAYDNPLPPGQHGLILGLGPGVTAVACKAMWLQD